MRGERDWRVFDASDQPEVGIILKTFLHGSVVLLWNQDESLFAVANELVVLCSA